MSLENMFGENLLQTPYYFHCLIYVYIHSIDKKNIILQSEKMFNIKGIKQMVGIKLTYY